MTKSKKVAIYSNTWDATGGGGIVYILAIARILKANGFDVTVFFNNTILLSELHSRYETEGLKIEIQKRNSIPLFFQVYFAVKEWLHFDIAIQQSLIAPRVTFVKKSFILCDFPMGKIVTLGEKIRLSLWNNIIVNSEYTKYWMQNYWKRDAVVFYPPIERPATLNQTRNLDMVCVGRFNNGKRSKRQDVVIAVLKDLILMGYMGINLHLIGYVQDDEYVNKLKEQSVGFPVFFHENCSNLNRIEILNKSAIFISACGYENEEPMLVEHYGISVVEAMAYGCIPVVIGKGGHKETVEHKKNGYHWFAKEELMEILTILINNQQLRNEISETAYLKSEQYSFIKLEQKILSIFKKYKNLR